MLNFAINNEAIQGSSPIPLLTKNPNIGGIKAMAKSSVTHPRTIKQRKHRIVSLGDRFERLTVIKESLYVSPHGATYRTAICECDCGKIVEPALSALWSGSSKSCGCLRQEQSFTNNKKHGLKDHPIYAVWQNMKGRCLNPDRPDYMYYGGKGIEICKEWQKDFQSFYDWAITRWKQDLIFDRIKVDENYHPDNCRFISKGLSVRNKGPRRNNRTGFRGVFLRKSGKYRAYITYNWEKFGLGQYDNPIDAAKAYDAKARELNAGHPLNFPDEEIDREQLWDSGTG